ncbi:MAG: 4-(cytidine 5'-diphospho)-2-C-methyl-D-erythritol kinase [Pseudomonadota bacterium]
MSVRIFAPAKINLTLEVGAPRADGRHPLQSVVVFADVGDWVEAEAAETLSLSLSGPFASALEGEDNLVLRAARALRVDAALHLEKQLPIASGIGGGSSDAAAALRALRALYGLEFNDDELAGLARELGADVPACVGAHSAWMTGTGEEFAPLNAPQLEAVLINPLKSLSTAEVYRQFDRMGLGQTFVPRAAPAWFDTQAAIADIKAVGNQLAAPAQALMPELVHIEATLSADSRVLHVQMSGSGATLFALTANREDAQSLARDLTAREPDWWVRATRLG